MTMTTSSSQKNEAQNRNIVVERYFLFAMRALRSPHESHTPWDSVDTNVEKGAYNQTKGHGSDNIETLNIHARNLPHSSQASK